MDWKVLLYVPSEIDGEEELKNWMKNPERGIICRPIGENLSKDELLADISGMNAEIVDCLMIAATGKEWRLAQEIGLAAIPYIGKSAPVVREVYDFSGAWMVVEGFDEVDYDFLHKAYLRAHDLPWTVITTERCFLREITMDDMDALFALYEQKGITDYTEALYPREQEEEYERAYIANMYRYFGYGMWLVCRKDTGEIIGRAGLEHRDYPEGTELEMGYLIAPKEQHKGYATEVCRAILEYADSELDFPRVNCLIERENINSIRLVEKLGFTFLEETDVAGKPMERYIKYCFLEENKI